MQTFHCTYIQCRKFFVCYIGLSRPGSVSSSGQEMHEEIEPNSQATDVSPQSLEDVNNKCQQLLDSAAKGDHSHNQHRIREEIKKQYSRLGSKMEEQESQNAREFVRSLEELIPQLEQMMDITEVDEALQKFAADFCTGKTSVIKACLDQVHSLLL